MTSTKLLYTSLLGAFLLAGCDHCPGKLTQAEQKVLADLREEKKAWDSERMQLQNSLECMENDKNEAVSERDDLREALKACQDKQVSAAETEPEGKRK